MRFAHFKTGLTMYNPYDFSDGESPSDLVFTRSHEELRRRKKRPHNEGLSFREKLNCKDYYNWE